MGIAAADIPAPGSLEEALELVERRKRGKWEIRDLSLLSGASTSRRHASRAGG